MFELFTAAPASQANAQHADGAVQVVSVTGPLAQGRDPFFDDYESIRERIRLALDSTARAVVLKINSPGGTLYGALDTARAIRADADAAGKPLVAFIDGDGCSAAYAIASAAERIVLGASSVVGSIGVLQAREDASRALAAQGVSVTYIASGSRKAYGRPETAMSERELAETQALVNQLAAPFVAHVAERRGLSTKVVAGYEAAEFTGPAAIQARLADAIMSLDATVASLATPQERKDTMQTNEDAKLQGQLATARKRLAALERPHIDALLNGQPKAVRDALRNKPLADVQAVVVALPRAPEPTTHPATSPVAARIAQQCRVLGYRSQKRVTKVINGVLYADVPEGYDLANHLLRK